MSYTQQKNRQFSSNNSLKTNGLKYLSGRRDSNPRPPAPKAGALTGLRYAPQFKVVYSLKSGAKIILFFEKTNSSRKKLVRSARCFHLKTLVLFKKSFYKYIF